MKIRQNMGSDHGKGWSGKQFWNSKALCEALYQYLGTLNSVLTYILITCTIFLYELVSNIWSDMSLFWLSYILPTLFSRLIWEFRTVHPSPRCDSQTNLNFLLPHYAFNVLSYEYTSVYTLFPEMFSGTLFRVQFLVLMI